MPMLYGAGPKTSAEGLAAKREQRMSKRQKKDAKKMRTVAAQLAERAFSLLQLFGEIAKARRT
jgi:hypothetical protein